MQLTKDQVEKLTSLARLKLTEEETTRYQKDLGAILEHVERLQKYMTDKDVTVDNRIVEDLKELRADEIKPCESSREELLRSARKIKDNLVVVPGVFKK